MSQNPDEDLTRLRSELVTSLSKIECEFQKTINPSIDKADEDLDTSISKAITDTYQGIAKLSHELRIKMIKDIHDAFFCIYSNIEEAESVLKTVERVVISQQAVTAKHERLTSRKNPFPFVQQD
eukprot:Clim_evm71s33 gene=Clim_evmTU71s33